MCGEEDMRSEIMWILCERENGFLVGILSRHKTLYRAVEAKYRIIKEAIKKGTSISILILNEETELGISGRMTEVDAEEAVTEAETSYIQSFERKKS